MAQATPLVVEFEPRVLVDMQTLHLAKGDVILLRPEIFINEIARAYLQRTFEDAFPGHLVIVLDAGIQVSVVAPGDHYASGAA